MAHAEPTGSGWRARFKRPDGSWGSQSGFSSEKAAQDFADEQEALIRRHLWVDPREAGTLFGVFAEEYLAAIKPRIAEGTAAKYRSHLDTHLIPQWGEWPLIGIFNSYVEIEKWVSELHEEYAESTVSSIFATFSTFMKAAVKERTIPANPCSGVRVTSGDYEPDRLVASPVQALRAAMRLYESGLGVGGFTLCLLDVYTGARWGELAGQQRHEYDTQTKEISVQAPLKEVGGTLKKYGAALLDTAPAPQPTTRRRRGLSARKGRTKTPAGTRVVELPPSIAVFYELLLGSHRHAFAFTSPEGRPWRRSNFRQRFWRPAWDGKNPEAPAAADHVPAILPWFTFHEGRHSHATWLTEDGVPEVARRARLGQKMKGIGRTYDHVTAVMRKQITEALEARWEGSLVALTTSERSQLVTWFPHLKPVFARLEAGVQDGKNPTDPISTPFDH
ncbi:tyrosine-type recombinase/integrase [Actinokineospora diospyrosa]|uniref:Phage integrase family protein n=1 Tax=Actinokineospora diospyrosa TaxID=103728 RepID=A0ABT1I5M3_9PSEU|nr:Phage integrase family protein [Actinokineospora diospyrosa]